MFPSRILAAGNSPMTSQTICGSGTAGLLSTGSDAAGALQLSTSMNRFTTASAGGAKLPPTEMGAEVWLRNDSGATITVYPYSTASTINAAAASFTVATAKTAIFKADSATTWMAVTTA